MTITSSPSMTPQTAADAHPAMVEISAPFATRAEYEAWTAQHASSLQSWRRAVIARASAHGVMTPLTGGLTGPRRIVVDASDLRESISVDQLNSRKRALLLQLALELRARGLDRRPNIKVLAPEATSRVAMILRGRYPYFLGGEYLPTPDEQAEFFPIPHVDLQRMPFPDGAFDVFVGGDLLKNVKDISLAQNEILRVMRPGGLIVSSFPFSANRDGTILSAGPAADGSAAPTRAGWDVLDGFRAAGCADAYMSFVQSSECGVAASDSAGVAVMTAVKASDRPSRRPAGAPYSGRRIKRVVALVGPPRSGTTLLTSMFAVHSDFHAIFEPWNSKALSGPQDATLATLAEKCNAPSSGATSVFVKETSAQAGYLENMRRLMASIGYPIKTHAMLILRRPAHTFISETRRRKEWWGATELELDARAFEAWCAKTRPALAKAVQMMRAFDGTLVSYEALARSPRATLERIADRIEFKIEPAQLDYHAHLDRKTVRGDINIGRAPAPIGTESIVEREREEALVQTFAASSPQRAWFEAATAFQASLEQASVAGVQRLDRDALQLLLA